MAKRVYRECSQFTHGNYSAWEVIKYPPVYDEKAFVKFLDEAESIKYIIEYSFFIRFIKEIPKEKILKKYSPEEYQEAEALLMATV